MECYWVGRLSTVDMGELLITTASPNEIRTIT